MAMHEKAFSPYVEISHQSSNAVLLTLLDTLLPMLAVSVPSHVVFLDADIFISPSDAKGPRNSVSASLEVSGLLLSPGSQLCCLHDAQDVFMPSFTRNTQNSHSKVIKGHKDTTCWHSPQQRQSIVHPNQDQQVLRGCLYQWSMFWYCCSFLAKRGAWQRRANRPSSFRRCTALPKKVRDMQQCNVKPFCTMLNERA